MKNEDPKLVAMARALFEGTEPHDPDDGHEYAKILDSYRGGPPPEMTAAREVPFKHPDELVALRHFSHESYGDDGSPYSRMLDHGHFLRRPGEHPEEFYQRALKSTHRYPSVGHQLVNPTLDDLTKSHERGGIEPGISHDTGKKMSDVETDLADEFDEWNPHITRDHFFFPVNRT